MNDTKDVQTSIEKLCKKYEAIAQQLSKPVQFITRPDENEVNFDISSIFFTATEILQKSIETSQRSEFSNPEIASINEQIYDAADQLNNRKEFFNGSFKSAKETLENMVSDLEKSYLDKTNEIILEHDAQKDEIMKEIEKTQDLYNSKLDEVLSPIQKEEAEIQSQILKLKNDYEETNQTLIKSVRNAKLKLEELSKQKEDYQNQAKVEDLKEEYNNLQKEYQQKIDEKRAEQSQLKAELDSIQTNFTTEETRLNNILSQMQATTETELKKSLDEQLSKHQQLKSKLESDHKKKEIDLKRLIEKEEQANSISVQKVKSEIEEQKRLIRDADDRYKNALHELEWKANSQLEERELEKQQIEKAQAKTLRQMANRQREQLAALRKESELARSSLEQKLQKTQAAQKKLKAANSTPATNSGSLKPSPQPSTNSSFLKPSLQPSTNSGSLKPSPQPSTNSSLLKPSPQPSTNSSLLKPSLQPSPNSNPSINPPKPSLPSAPSPGLKLAPRRRYKQQPKNSISETNSEYDAELSERMKSFDFALKMENDAILQTADAIEKQATYTNEIARLGVKRARRRLANLHAEKERLVGRINSISEKSDSATDQESVAKLQARISMQYNAIAELKNANQKIKNEKPSNVDISVIKAEHKKELEKMRGRLTTIENTNKKKVQQVKDDYAKKIQNEVENREKTLGEINDRIAELDAEIERIALIAEEQELKDHQEWVKLRKEMTDSTHRLMSGIQSNDINAERNPGPVQALHVEPKSFLPLLKH